MKKLFTLASMAFTTLAMAQTNAPGITVSPMGTNGSTPITVTMTLEEVCTPEGRDMDPTWQTIAFHSGGIVGGQGWQNTVEWNAANSLTFNKVSDGVWSATFTPNDYYGITVEGFSFVFNGFPNTDGDWDAEAKAFNLEGNCDDFFWFFNDEPASLNKEELNAALSVYPNPAIDVITFDVLLSNATSAIVNIMDLSGRVIATHKLVDNQAKVDVAGLASGTYIYEVTSGEAVASGRFIKK